jgi:hypothetical protein
MLRNCPNPASRVCFPNIPFDMAFRFNSSAKIGMGLEKPSNIEALVREF